ncbi:interaptin [Lucilia cuprina]|uniref:interaptin n=1 Tax=Lucilia cuprina TaxID=7375 RepID=UPI001F05CF07|nr:interaptin [Lucilia cuprina]XP_046807662.1 interaptin [Lucilia cuprina]
MDFEADDLQGLPASRRRTFSNASQQSQLSSKQNFPLMTSDSGLYTCSSNASDCSLPMESDTDSSLPSSKLKLLKNERLQLALQDVRKLRSELERLTKSEQWYKQELRQQKTTRLEDLERIYTQERKFMQENQRLQKECVRLYEKCNELERELEKQNQENSSNQPKQHMLEEEDVAEENILKFEKEQHMALIKDQQQLISVLRKQKRSLLEDLRCLTVEKDEKVMELQRLLADLEFDNKLITKKCTQFAKERNLLENNLKQTDCKLTGTLEEKMNLQKSIVELKEQLVIQKELLKLKESEIENIQQHYTNKIQEEEDMEQVHNLSIKYQEEINSKTLEIINLKERLQEMQDEMENMQQLQQQNELQQRQIEQLNYSLEAYRLELQELKTSEQDKNKQLQDLHQTMDDLIKDKNKIFKTTVEQQNDLLRLKQALKTTQEQYEQVQELYKNTQFQLELLELEHGKVKFQNERDRQEIEHLRNKLKQYLQQTAELSNKLQLLEQEMVRVLKENSQLKQESQEMKKQVKEQEILLKEMEEIKLQDLTGNKAYKGFKHQENVLTQTQEIDKSSADQDFIELQLQCEKLQAKLDFIQQHQTQTENHVILQTLNDFVNQVANVQKEEEIIVTNSCLANDNLEKESDFVKLSLQSNKLQENLNKLNDFLQEKQQLVGHLDKLQESNKGLEKLVKENEILKQKLSETETEACSLQIKQDINERTQKYTLIEENLEEHKLKVKALQDQLLENDAKLYKMQRKFDALKQADVKLEEFEKENKKLKEQLRQELESKTDLNKKLQQEKESILELKNCLDEIKMKQKLTKHQAIQCNLQEDTKESHNEVQELKEHVLKLQQQQQMFLEQETHKKEERLHFLHKMLELQNNKMHNLQQQQQDWQEMLTSLNTAQDLEEKTRKELELKRLELEELNQVFAEQNEELRKLEEFTTLLELKRQQEKEQLKLTFQQEINVMKQHLQQCQQEIKQQKLINLQLEERNERFQLNINEDYATEVAEYKKEIRELKSRVSRIMKEKEDLKEQLMEVEKQTKQLKDNKREAILMPELSLVKLTEMSVENTIETVEVLKETISEDHLRILTKVLEAEYQRKMQRYDEHIHSLLSNLKSLKKSLKANEEKTALLSEEQLKTKEELIELQKTKRSLEDMRLKYEQSQDTIKELKQSLAFERKKFELSDIGKSSQTNGTTTYEVSNLIDDYKKLIQQSALVTKRPSTSAILDLIQRSNQCVPNLHKLETNVDGLRSELQNFLTSYNHKMSTNSLIAAASLNVPPSLMDELRAASEGF